MLQSYINSQIKSYLHELLLEIQFTEFCRVSVFDKVCIYGQLSVGERKKKHCSTPLSEKKIKETQLSIFSCVFFLLLLGEIVGTTLAIKNEINPIPGSVFVMALVDKTGTSHPYLAPPVVTIC